MKRLEFQQKQNNPDVDVLFEQADVPQPEDNEAKQLTPEELEAQVDPRNNDPTIGFVDVMGYRLRVTSQAQMQKLPVNLNTWQNLWIRFATNMDQKSKNTLGKDSRYYKFMQSIR